MRRIMRCPPVWHLLLVLTVVLLILSPFVNATTLVAFRNAHSVVLAADSKYTPLRGNLKPYARPKIYPCGEYFVAVAGVFKFAVVGEHFDLTEILTNACKPKRTPLQMMNAIAESIRTNYDKILEGLDFLEPTATRAMAASRTKPIAENVILVGSYRGIPFILTYDLKPVISNGRVLAASQRSIKNKPLIAGISYEYAYGGVYGDLFDFMVTNPEDVPMNNLMEAAHFLIDYQIGKRPEISGYPIEVVEVTAEGKVNWLFCDPQCSPKVQVAVLRGKQLRRKSPGVTRRSSARYGGRG